MKTTFNKESKLRMPDMGSVVFTFIAFCLTVISAYNGFFPLAGSILNEMGNCHP